MHLLTILTDGAVVTGFDVQRIGWTSRASSLVYLGNNLLFVGSTLGDSQLFSIDFDSTTKGFLNLVQTFPNNAPILDFAVMDIGHREQDGLGNEYSSGQARLWLAAAPTETAASGVCAAVSAWRISASLQT